VRVKKMTKRFWNLFKVSPVVIAATFFAANSALAGEVNEQLTNVGQLSEAQGSNNLDQVTSVSQFSDVQPTDWAFQALQSLVERYGCIAGYPNGTFRGNRALTRYEFAAGLNACLDRVNELIATATADLVSKQDLATLQRLQEEYAAELATLRGRVDSLEARTSELEAHQFSTTTKLVGQAIFNIAEDFGNKLAVPSGQIPTNKLNSNAFFSDRINLNLYTSFTGTDQLQTRLAATSTSANNGTITGTNETRFGFDGIESSIPVANNSVGIDKLNYAFNVTKGVRVKIEATGANEYENAYTFNPDFADTGTGAVSRYGRFSPIYRQSGGGVNAAAGITVSFHPENSPVSAVVSYLGGATNSSNGTTNYSTGGPNVPTPGAGLFDGNSSVFGQLEFHPNKAFGAALTYVHGYQNSAGGVSILGITGSSLANAPFGQVATVIDSYGAEVSLRPSNKIALSGWGGYTSASPEIGTQQSADIWYWGATLALRDFGKEGNVLGLVFGQPPKITGGKNFTAETGTPYQVEGLYKFKVSDNILVTPGVIVIFNPENNTNNDTEYVGIMRTTFTF
jgi:hypothetical protein